MDLYTTSSGNTIAADPAKNTQLLAEAIPALSTATGSRYVAQFGDGTGQAYFFRIRTVEQNDKIVSALYGKIDSGIVLDPLDASSAGYFFHII